MTASAPATVPAYELWLQRGDVDAVAAVCKFFAQNDPVHLTLRKIAEKLRDLNIPYAVAGGMALVAHRFIRATVDVDILVHPSGLNAIHQSLEGLGYVPLFAGSKNL